MVTHKQPPSRTPTQEIALPERYSEAWFRNELTAHPTRDACDAEGGECSICAWRDCPHHEPMHYHHDGCPACDVAGCEQCKTLYGVEEPVCPSCGAVNPASAPVEAVPAWHSCPDCREQGRCMLHHPDAPNCAVITTSNAGGGEQTQVGGPERNATDSGLAAPAPAEEPALPAATSAPDSVRPVPRVTVVHFDVWPYGDALWVERRVEGDNVDTLNGILRGARCFDSIATAALRTGDDLRAWGVRCFDANGLVHAHAEEKIAPRTGPARELDGKIDEPDLKIEFGGGCPIQGYGTAFGHSIYYRARGTGWRVDFWEPGVDLQSERGLPDGEIFEFGRDNDCAWPDAGWLHHEESEARIREAVAAFAAWRATR